MKLPKDKKKQLQILAVAVTVVVAAIYAFFAFLIMPLTSDKKTYKADIATYSTKITEAGKKIQEANSAKEKRKELRAHLRNIDDQYILKAEFNNYEIKAREYIEKVAATANMTLDSISPVGEVTVSDQGGQFRSYVMYVSGRLSGLHGYDTMTNLFWLIENNNPYMSISKVSISPSADPISQGLTFTVAWPIWANPAIATNFLPVTEEVEETNAPASLAERRRKRS